MTEKIQLFSDLPKYLEVKNRIKRMIESGEYEGAKLCSERDLCQIFGVSRPTVKHALKLLEKDGIIQIRNRSGVFVRAKTLSGDISRQKKEGLRFAVLSPENRRDYYIGAIVTGIEDDLRHQNAACIHVGQRYQLLDYSSMDGVIVALGGVDSEWLSKHFQVPVVFLSIGQQLVEGTEIDTVTTDDVWSSRMAVKYLLSLGHRRIAFITGILQRPRGTRGAVERLDGYRKGMEEAGIKVSDSWIAPGAWSSESGYLAGKSLMALRPRPTAIFASNDRMAIGAMRAIAEEGLETPRDVSVVGFDNIDPAAHVNPPLTTMDSHLEEQGRTAVRLLFERMGSPGRKSQCIRIKGSLVIRDSCSVPPQENDA